MQLKGRNFWLVVSIIGIIFIFFLFSIINNTVKSKEASNQIVSLESELENERVNLKDKDNYITELEAKVKEAEPWFETSEKEQERQIAKEKKKQEEEEAAAKKKAEEKETAAKKKAEEEEKERIAAEEEEKRKQEEKEKQGFDTGITYDQLARTPDDYEGEKVKFKGKVIQVMEGDDSVQLRIAVNDDYDQVIYAEYDASIVDSRVLEDDHITVMGISVGLLTYESTMGGKITIPALLVTKIEQ